MSSCQPCTTTVGQSATGGSGGRPGMSNAGAIRNMPRAATLREAAAVSQPPRLEPTNTGGTGDALQAVSKTCSLPSALSMPR